LSRLSVTVELVPGQATQRRISFSPRYDTASYTVETSADLRHWAPLSDFTVTDSGLRRTVTDLAATQSNRYYRVGVSRP
jgi:hypothetical protein